MLIEFSNFSNASGSRLGANPSIDGPTTRHHHLLIRQPPGNPNRDSQPPKLLLGLPRATKIANGHEPKILHLRARRSIIWPVVLAPYAPNNPHQNRTTRQRPQILRHRRLPPHLRVRAHLLPRRSSAARMSIESCKLLVRWSCRIHECARIARG
jgi:hypothetical protein